MRRDRQVWLHVETKHPSYFRALGLGLEEPLATLLRRYGRDRRDSAVFLQSFEPSSIQRLSRLVSAPRVVLLSAAGTRPWDFEQAKDPRTVADLVKPEGLRWIAGFAQGIGPTMDLILPRDAAGKLGAPTTLVKDAHAHGLVLHPYTARNENSFLAGRLPQGHGSGRVRGRLRRLPDVLRTGHRRHLHGQPGHRAARGGSLPPGPTPRQPLNGPSRTSGPGPAGKPPGPAHSSRPAWTC